MRGIIVGSRQSQLALTQSNNVIETLKQLELAFTYDLKKIITKGDRILDVTLSKVGGKGLFVKEIEQALLNREIDIAVHSMKDMPAEMPDGLTIGAVTERVDPRDCIVSKGGATLANLPRGARIGTSSLRRAAQLKSFRSDFEIVPIRGNVDSRLRKLQEEDFDAIVLAAAGMERLNFQHLITEYVSIDISLPAVGQGALGIQCRIDDVEVLELLHHIDHPSTRTIVTAERALLNTLEGSCQVPIAAYGSIDQEEIALTGFVGLPDGSFSVKLTKYGLDPYMLGHELANELILDGAEEILDRVKREALDE